MKCEIKIQEKCDEALMFCLSKLPNEIKEKILDFINNNPYKTINEIRLHKDADITLIADSRNIKTNIFLSNNDLNAIFENLCENSLYAHVNTIKHGYISVGKGIRAGVCGKATIEQGEVCGIYDISSINLRIPQHIHNASSFLYNLLKKHDFNISVLIFSAPGIGKTTILKDLIYKLLNETDKRVAVIDSREEITPFLTSQKNGDFYLGYPKGLGIELATKSMTPQILVCDEISSKNEAEEINSSANSGVKLIASTHASSYEELLNKTILEDTFKYKIFDYTLGVKRDEGKRKYVFSLYKL